jgi:hypothetical protein
MPLGLRSFRTNELGNSVMVKNAISSLLLMMILITSILLLSYPQQSNAQTSNICPNQPLSINKSSGSDVADPPANAIDNNLNTQWSKYGIGSWIVVDIGSVKLICSVDIAWYRGNLRQYTFDIRVWSTPNQQWVTVYAARSSGTTASFENYDIANINGRYVAITVKGNTENNYASISEIDVNALTASSVDKFGIRKIYPTKTGGEEWFMNMINPTSDSRTIPPAMTKNSDGSWKVTNTQTRYRVFPSTGWNDDLYTTLDQKALAQKGYMQGSNDWKNVEMTGYIKANTAGSETKFIWYNRGGQHRDSQPCEGTAYKGNLYFDGRTRFQKEQWHPGGYPTTFSPIPATTSLEDRWVGFKYVVYNFVQNGKVVVKMQNWIDDRNNGNWVKIAERVDSGGWGTYGTKCGGAPDQLITWGGPQASFRWDYATNVDIKNLSIREIQPPTS